MVKLFILGFILLFAQVCHAQKQFTTIIRLPATIDAKRIIVEYDDGKDTHPASTTFFKDEATISGTFYSKYATLTIRYLRTENTFYHNDYFLKEGNSSLTFTECRNADTVAYPFDSCKLSNAIEIRNLPEAKKLHLLTEKEEAQMNELVSEYYNKQWENKQDSLMQVMNFIDVIRIEKEMEFVKQNSDKYYSIWLFRQKFLNLSCIQRYYDTLSKIFASFPAKFRNSVEGKEIVKRMNGVMLTKKGFYAPVFTAKDIFGATIELSHYRGKYVLLQFWASWCGPCLQEMPAIKKIHDSYTSNELEVISITIDRDSAAFAKAMATNKMNWTNIFDGRWDIYAIYGEKPVPSVYLVNKEGVIVYSSWEDNLNALNDLLSRQHL